MIGDYIVVAFVYREQRQPVMRCEDKAMQHYTYLIIGGSMTADAAVQGIRSVDAASKIGVISAESDPPYNRPPLSKSLWKGESVDTIWRKTDDQNVTFHLPRTVTAIEPANKQV